MLTFRDRRIDFYDGKDTTTHPISWIIPVQNSQTNQGYCLKLVSIVLFGWFMVDLFSLTYKLTI